MVECEDCLPKSLCERHRLPLLDFFVHRFRPSNSFNHHIKTDARLITHPNPALMCGDLLLRLAIIYVTVVTIVKTIENNVVLSSFLLLCGVIPPDVSCEGINLAMLLPILLLAKFAFC